MSEKKRCHIVDEDWITRQIKLTEASPYSLEPANEVLEQLKKQFPVIEIPSESEINEQFPIPDECPEELYHIQESKRTGAKYVINKLFNK